MTGRAPWFPSLRAWWQRTRLCRMEARLQAEFEGERNPYRRAYIRGQLRAVREFRATTGPPDAYGNDGYQHDGMTAAVCAERYGVCPHVQPYAERASHSHSRPDGASS